MDSSHLCIFLFLYILGPPQRLLCRTVTSTVKKFKYSIFSSLNTPQKSHRSLHTPRLFLTKLSPSLIRLEPLNLIRDFSIPYYLLHLLIKSIWDSKMMQDMWNAPPGFRPTKSAPSSPAKPLGVSRTRSESFHVTHKVPVGDTPYVRAKNVQVSFWAFFEIWFGHFRICLWFDSCSDWWVVFEFE